MHGAEGERHVAPVAALLRVVLVHRHQLDDGRRRGAARRSRSATSPANVPAAGRRVGGSSRARAPRTRPAVACCAGDGRGGRSPAEPRRAARARCSAHRGARGRGAVVAGREQHLPRRRVEQHLRRIDRARRRRRRRGRTPCPPPRRPPTAPPSSFQPSPTELGRRRSRRSARCRPRSPRARELRTTTRTRPANVAAVASPPMAGDPARSSTTVTAALRAHGYLPDEGLATAIFLALTLRRPLLLEGEAGVGKTEVAKVLSALDRRRADPPAVLRGHRRRPGRLRLGLRPPAAAPPRRRGERRGGRASAPTTLEAELYHERFLVKRALLQAIDPDATGPAGAADRRDRPRRRRVRGVPARGAVGLADHRARARRVPHRRARRSSCSPPTAPATCTTPSSAAACTTGSSTPASTARWRSCACACPTCQQRPRPPGRRRRRGAARAQPVQAAGRRRDDRLGRRPSAASASASSTSASVAATLGAVLKYREDQERVAPARVRRHRQAAPLEHR